MLFFSNYMLTPNDGAICLKIRGTRSDSRVAEFHKHEVAQAVAQQIQKAARNQQTASTAACFSMLSRLKRARGRDDRGTPPFDRNRRRIFKCPLFRYVPPRAFWLGMEFPRAWNTLTATRIEVSESLRNANNSARGWRRNFEMCPRS